MTGAELDGALAALGWTRAQLAALLQCDESLVRKWARGDAGVPPPIGRWLSSLVRAWRNHPVPEWRERLRRAPVADGPAVILIPRGEGLRSDEDRGQSVAADGDASDDFPVVLDHEHVGSR